MADNAFPNPALVDENYLPRPGDYGLTKREYAAIHIAAALAGRGVTYGNDRIAKTAVELADAVLKEANHD